jgi:hypothetical protein
MRRTAIGNGNDVGGRRVSEGKGDLDGVEDGAGDSVVSRVVVLESGSESDRYKSRF